MIRDGLFVLIETEIGKFPNNRRLETCARPLSLSLSLYALPRAYKWPDNKSHTSEHSRHFGFQGLTLFCTSSHLSIAFSFPFLTVVDVM